MKMASSVSTLPSLVLVLVLLLLSSIIPLPVLSSPCNKEDKKALLAFMDAFGSPPAFPSWTSDTACCDWYGVQCDATGRLYELDIIQGASLKGPIPPSIGNFPTLQVLRLHKLPNIVGPIPPQIANLKKLRFLTISWTNISGSVPAFLADLPALEQLDLSFNNLSGAIPAAIGDHAKQPALYSIDISRNHLTGAIPATLMQNAQNAYLILSHNQLTGPIPVSFGSVDFAEIDVSRNQLTGDASFLFGVNKTVQQIDLSRNQLEFDFTNVVFVGESNLLVLNLDHNKIYGQIPQQIVDLTFLQFFNVSYNRLCGEIPAGGLIGLGKDGRFDEYCFFHNKCLCGPPLPTPCK